MEDRIQVIFAGGHHRINQITVTVPGGMTMRSSPGADNAELYMDESYGGDGDEGTWREALINLEATFHKEVVSEYCFGNMVVGHKAKLGVATAIVGTVLYRRECLLDVVYNRPPTVKKVDMVVLLQDGHTRMVGSRRVFVDLGFYPDALGLPTADTSPMPHYTLLGPIQTLTYGHDGVLAISPAMQSEARRTLGEIDLAMATLEMDARRKAARGSIRP